MVKQGKVNIVNLIFGLRDAKEDLSLISSILEKHELPSIQDAQSTIASFVFSITNQEMRENLYEILQETTCLPIVQSYLKSEEESLQRFFYKVTVKKLSGLNLLNVIMDLKEEAVKDNKDVSLILFRHDIPRIEALEKRVLEFLFNVENKEFRSKLIDILANANSLPIFSECNKIIVRKVSRRDYISESSVDVLTKKLSTAKYDLCTRLIGESSVLQEKIIKIKSLNEQDAAKEKGSPNGKGTSRRGMIRGAM